MKNPGRNADTDLSIGSLASAAGVNVETIRFYQRKGLIPIPAPASGGMRRYGEVDLARVRFIKSAQRLGFSLDEVVELLRLDDGTHCRAASALAQAKLAQVRSKLADLKGIESALAQLVQRCTSARGNVSCPLINSLQQH